MDKAFEVRPDGTRCIKNQSWLPLFGNLRDLIMHEYHKSKYSIHPEPQGVIYEDKLKRKRLMRTEELYKFSDGTITSVRNTLDQMLKNLKLRYNKVMKRRKLTATDQKWSRIMIKDIDQQLLNRRIMRSLEKFVSGRDFGTDYRLLQRTI
ncbi:hypothetical protein Tco_0404653 [Tanacetum coccineum]